MRQLIDKQTIDIQTKILGKRIADEHRGDKTPVVLVGLLNGCFMFYADLVRAIDTDIECDFMRVKSYIGKKKQGDVEITKDLERSIKGKHVYIVDDIYDTGNTVSAVIEYLRVKHPASISVVTLITRSNNHNPCPVKHQSAFTIDDEWIVGYGLDNEKGYCRNYSDIYAL